MAYHFSVLEKILLRLGDVNLILNEDKCTFAVRTFTGLGNKITPNKIFIDEKRINTIMGIPRPKSYHDLHSFLGLINQVHDHVRQYADLTECLQKLLKTERQQRLDAISKTNANQKQKETILKKKPSRIQGPIWTEEDIQRFELLRHAIATAPCISFIDTNKLIVITIDASTYGVGNALYQPDFIGQPLTLRNLVTFRSHALKSYQKNYSNSAYKLELWALVQALNDYRDYLWGRSFIVYTDHQALQSLHSNKAVTNRHMNHWVEVIQDYNFSIILIPGITNVLADSLSRVYPHIWGIPTTNSTKGLTMTAEVNSRDVDKTTSSSYELYASKVDWPKPMNRRRRRNAKKALANAAQLADIAEDVALEAENDENLAAQDVVIENIIPEIVE
jgi:hypothetical protein